MDYDLYEYLENQVDEYVPLKELLKQNNMTFEHAVIEIENFRRKYSELLLKYNISNRNIAGLVTDLAERVEEMPENKDLQYIYIYTITDNNLLNMADENTDDEQNIRNYMEQECRAKELVNYLEMQIKYRDEVRFIAENLKGTEQFSGACNEETDSIYKLTLQYSFINESMVYRDNLNALISYINSSCLKKIKPYVIFTVITRKHGMMQDRTGFIPNLKIIFQYQKYSIYNDNRKNFDNYTEYIELYLDLCEFYGNNSDADIDLCNFCFSATSSLSEWFYLWCKPDIDIPMSFRQIADLLKSPVFPMLYTYEEYNNHSVDELEKAETEILEKTLDIADLFTKI